jgi:hypothetical protein
VKIVRALRRAFGLASMAGLAVFALLAPRAVQACAVCSAGRDDESNTAFLISTVFLSVLPLAGLGTLVFVLWRRIQRLEAEAPTGPDARAASPIAGA